MFKNIKEKILYLRGYQDDISLGDYYFKEKKDLNLACQYYQKATEENSPIAYQRLSEIENEKGDIAKSFYFMGLKHEAQGRWTEAYNVYSCARSLYEHPESIYRLALLYQEDRYEDSLLVIQKNKEEEIKYYVAAASQLHLDALDTLDTLSLENKEAAYQLGLLYENDFKETQIAIEYFLKAARKKHSQALSKLELLTDDLNDSSLFKLGFIYVKVFNQYSKGLNCFYSLSKKGNKEAARALDVVVKLSPICSLQLARKYGEDHELEKAIHYYLISAKSNQEGSDSAVTALERLIHKLDDKSLLELAKIYQNKNDQIRAISCLQLLADKDNQTALKQINSIIDQNPDYAYDIALIYESEKSVKAILYYFHAAKRKHVKAIHALQRLFDTLDRHEQYQLGNLYLSLDNATSALTCFKLLADKNHLPAIKKINKITTRPEYAYELAKIYDSERKTELVFHYLILAARHKHDKAMAILERSYDHLDNESRFSLGKIYLSLDGKIKLAFKCFKELAEKEYTKAKLEIKGIMDAHPKYAFILGELFEEDKNLKSAVHCYFIAANDLDGEAINALVRLKDKLNQDAQVKLGIIHLKNNDIKSAFECFKPLVLEGHSEAIKQINRIAEQNSNYAYQLAQVYINQDKVKGFQYYLMAADNYHDEATHFLEESFLELNDEIKFKLGTILVKQHNTLSALKCFKVLADKKHRPSINELEALTRLPENAFTLAKLYELDIPENLEKVCHYYTLAATKGSKPAFDEITALAKTGDKRAQFALGYHYYIQKNQFIEGIHLCLLAFEQDYQSAQDYLTKTDFDATECLIIAKKFEEGDGIQQNLLSALQFYEKACSLNNTEAALYLGYFYQTDHLDIALVQNNDKACDYLIKAALLGSPDAVVSLECLSQDVSPSMQSKIANMYDQHPARDEFRVTTWSKIAQESTKNAQNFSTSANFFQAKRDQSSFEYSKNSERTYSNYEHIIY